ncbi:MAG TPA: hypothetical protein VMO20_00590 [Candidatus Acidoferrum sp.]|nr:hypothetical protein [Candidatus Acidoferrum sp.]
MNSLAITEDALKCFRDAATKFTRDASPRAFRLLTLRDDLAVLRIGRFILAVGMGMSLLISKSVGGSLPPWPQNTAKTQGVQRFA